MVQRPAAVAEHTLAKATEHTLARVYLYAVNGEYLFLNLFELPKL